MWPSVLAVELAKGRRMMRSQGRQQLVSNTAFFVSPSELKSVSMTTLLTCQNTDIHTDSACLPFGIQVVRFM